MSSLGDQDRRPPPVAQITVGARDEDISRCDEDSLLGMSFKSVDSKALVNHVVGRKEREERTEEDDGDSNVSEKKRRTALTSEDIFGSGMKKRRVTNPGINTYVNKALKELIHSTLDTIVSSGEEPSIEHSAIQNIKMDHQLQDDQISRQIKNWSEQKQSTTTGSPSTPAAGASVVSEPADAEKEAGDTSRKASECYACIKRRGCQDFDFSVEFIGGPDDPVEFGNNVVGAINHLHGKGYSFVEDEEEQGNWKKILNFARDNKHVNLTDRIDEPRTVGVFSKEAGASKGKSHRPMMLAIFQEPRNSDTVVTHKKGMFYLQGSYGESFVGPHAAVGKAIKEAFDLGYEKMKGREEERWSDIITKFTTEDILFDFYMPEEYEEGLFDLVAGVFEKKSKS